jgi:hypothetical protein
VVLDRLRDTGTFFVRCGDDLLSHVLRRSTISAVALNGRVRDGIGCFAHAMITTPKKERGGGAGDGVSHGPGDPWSTVWVSAVDHVLIRDRVRRGFASKPTLRTRSIAGTRSTVFKSAQLMLWCVYILISVQLLLDQIKPIGPLVPVN